MAGISDERIEEIRESEAYRAKSGDDLEQREPDSGEVVAIINRLKRAELERGVALRALDSIVERFERQDKGTLDARPGVAWAMHNDAKTARQQITAEREAQHEH